MAKDTYSLKLGASTAFDKSRLKRLRQANDTWEADFRALPTPIMENQTHYLGLVVAKRGGKLLAQITITGRPSANDLAALLANAMRQPKTGSAHRPRRIHVRGHRQWQPLFPHLDKIGIRVSVTTDLPRIRTAYQEYWQHLREARRSHMVRPTAAQQAVEQLFPAIAQWVKDYGHIEIGDQETFGFVVRALDHGGLILEDDRPETLAEAMAALEKGLRKWFREQGIDLG